MAFKGDGVIEATIYISKQPLSVGEAESSARLLQSWLTDNRMHRYISTVTLPSDGRDGYIISPNFSYVLDEILKLYAVKKWEQLPIEVQPKLKQVKNLDLILIPVLPLYEKKSRMFWGDQWNENAAY